MYIYVCVTSGLMRVAMPARRANPNPNPSPNPIPQTLTLCLLVELRGDLDELRLEVLDPAEVGEGEPVVVDDLGR